MMLVIAIFASASALPCWASHLDEVKSTAVKKINNQLKSFAHGDVDAFTTYLKLRSEYRNVNLSERNYASQILSMYDAMNGRYDDADIHFRDAFPGASKSLTCPTSGYQAVSLKNAIAVIAGKSRILMINESHSEIGTRALIYEMLPTLKELGFRYVAFEALAVSKNVSVHSGTAAVPSLDDKKLIERGYAIDSNKAGFYIREPVFGELIRESIRLGFGLVAYDPRRFSSRKDREEKEAQNLSVFLDQHPSERLLVVAGYSHILKTDGWMADELRRRGDYKITSVDQVDGIGGCGGIVNDVSYPYVLKSKDSASKFWSYQSGSDVTVLQVLDNLRGAKATWLTLGGVRRELALPRSVCREKVPCMVSATYASESDDAVPADRLIVFGREKPILYLSPGTYRLSTQTRIEKLIWHLVVGLRGSSLREQHPPYKK